LLKKSKVYRMLMMDPVTDIIKTTMPILLRRSIDSDSRTLVGGAQRQGIPLRRACPASGGRAQGVEYNTHRTNNLDFTSFTSITFYHNTDPVNDPITGPIKSIESIDYQMIKIVDLMIDSINANVKQRYADILKLLLGKGIINRRQIAEELDVPKDTVKRDLAFMRSKNIITFEGPNRNGGYVFTDSVKELM